MKKRRLLIAQTILFFLSCAKPTAKPSDSGDPMEAILAKLRPQFSAVLDNPAQYRLQILYTQIDRDAANRPAFVNHGYRLTTADYFYPASSIKLPAAALALEKLNDLNIAGLDKTTALRIDSAFGGQTAVAGDASAANGQASIAHYIKKILLVSDNDAYNRMFEFVGQREMHQRMADKGYQHTQIIRRLSVSGTPDQQRYTNPFTFYDGDRVIYHQPMAVNPDTFRVENMNDIRQGKGYMSGGKLVEEPIDFSNSNYMSIMDLQKVVKAIIFPESLPENERFRLSDDDLYFLRQYMSMLPRESRDPVYDNPEVHCDGCAKTLIYGGQKDVTIPAHIRIFSKSGGAYGYLIENAYIADYKAGVEFLLTAVIQVNANQIYNDDTYEYTELGVPFMAALGKAVYDYETRRKRAFPPDLSNLQSIQYE